MKLDLKPTELDALIESLEYSKQRIRDAKATPYATQTESLARLGALASKLRDAKRGV